MAALDFFKPKDVIKQRWVIHEKLGAGGYGQIYRGKHREGILDDVAIKVEPGGSEQARIALRTEAYLLKRLHGGFTDMLELNGALKLPCLNRVLALDEGYKHFCRFYEFGETEVFSYLVMSSCSKTLAELRRGMSDNCFSPSTTFRVGIQILKAIDDLHSIGFIHRDIKPSNFMMGKGNNSKVLYMLDFGLARKFLTPKGDEVREKRSYAGFRGTIRYASISTHRNEDLGRKDDLWSMFYMMVEFLQGQLPWSRYKDKDEVLRKKEEYSVEMLSDGLNEWAREALRNCAIHLGSLSYESKPNYIAIKECFCKVLTGLKVQPDDKYDWESMGLNLEALAKKIKEWTKTGGSTRFDSKKSFHRADTDPFDDGENWNFHDLQLQNVNITPSSQQIAGNRAVSPWPVGTPTSAQALVHATQMHTNAVQAQNADTQAALAAQAQNANSQAALAGQTQNANLQAVKAAQAQNANTQAAQTAQAPRTGSPAPAALHTASQPSATAQLLPTQPKQDKKSPVPSHTGIPEAQPASPRTATAQPVPAQIPTTQLSVPTSKTPTVSPPKSPQSSGQ